MSFVLFGAALAMAPPAEPEAQMAECAWEKAAASSATLIAKAQLDKRYIYDAEGSPTVGPLMRIRAACGEQTKALRADSSFSTHFDTRKFVKLLKETRPSQVVADQVELPVLRCEFRFQDASKERRPAAVIWSYGDGPGRRELSASHETFGIALTPQDIAILAANRDPSEIFNRLDKVEPVRVATEAAGKAAAKPYMIDIEKSARTCQRANSDGSYSDA